MLASKGHYPATFRSLFGDVPVQVRRLLVCPCHDPGEPKSFAALDFRGDAVAPELAYVTARDAALVPFGKVGALLSEFLPVDGAQHAGTVRNRALRVGEAIVQPYSTEIAEQPAAPADGSVVVGLDGGYVRSRHRCEERHFEVIAGKVIDAEGVQHRRCCRDPAGSSRSCTGVAGRPLTCLRMPSVPFKLNQDRRHHIPKQKRKVTNWREYDASLRQRGSLTVWFSAEAIEGWRAAPRTTRGGQPCYSPLAILTALTLRAVFRLALRQTAGLIGSIIGLRGLDLTVPDHTTLSRRAATLQVPRPRSSSSTDASHDAAPVHLIVDSTGLKLCGPG